MGALLMTLVLWTGVPVSCSTQPLPMAGAIAVYDMSHPAITLSQSVCDRLELLRQGARPRSLYTQRDVAEAVWVTAHEYARAKGINQQPASDCAGLTYFADLAQRLGVRPAYALELYGFAQAAKFGQCRAVGQSAYTSLARSVAFAEQPGSASEPGAQRAGIGLLGR